VEIKRGDVFLVDLNPVVGAEQAGIRPALVIQIDKEIQLALTQLSFRSPQG